MGFSLLHWNANGLKAHFALFFNYVHSLQTLPDIICIQESFLKPQHKFSFKGYSIIRKDRTCSPKGGVVTLVRDSLSYAQVECPDDIESIGVSVSFPEGNITVYNVYIAPDATFELSSLKSLFVERSIVCGDFNAHCYLWGSSINNRRGLDVEQIITSSNSVFFTNSKRNT